MERVDFKDIIQTWLNGRRDAMRQEYNSSGRKASGYFGEHIDVEMYDEGGRINTPLYVGSLVFGRLPELLSLVEAGHGNYQQVYDLEWSLAYSIQLYLKRCNEFKLEISKQ